MGSIVRRESPHRDRGASEEYLHLSRRADAMPGSLVEQVLRAIENAQGLYHRLALLVGSPGTGKTVALLAVAEQIRAPRINLNLELSRRLMGLTARQRVLRLPAVLTEVLAAVTGDILLLDNIEMLFDAALQQDPLRHFQAASRNRTVVVAWPGAVARDDRGQASLTYAAPGHSEYRRYPAADLVVVESLAVA